MKSKAKVRKLYGLLLKITIIIAAYGFIYNRIFHKKDFDKILDSFESLFESSSFLGYLGIIVLLMFINWSIESWKWKYLIKKIETISFVKALKAVLSGITISTFTPNRVGEFFGRIFILEKANHWEGIFITIIGSISQLLITIITGLIGFLFFYPEYVNIQNHFPVYYYYSIVFIVIILVVLFLFLYFNVSLITSFTNKIKRIRESKFQQHVKIFSLYTNKELFYVLFMSLVRYVVFAVQFYLLLLLFNVDIPFMEAFAIISLVFFVVTVIPTITLSELGVRGTVAIFLIGMYFEKYNMLNEQINIGIFAASLTLWLINLAIPALIGSIFVFNLNFFRKNN